MTGKQIVVIGGGVVGVCTAYFLAQAGHDVAVIERHENVAEEASFGNAGMIAPSATAPWALPGMPRSILKTLFRAESPVLLRPRMDRALWRWIRQWMSECELERYRINRTRMQRVAFYSRDILSELIAAYEIDYEQTEGMLQVFRSPQDMRLAEPALALLAEYEIPHKLMDSDEARTIEPSLAYGPALAGALHLPQDESGNCPLFTKRLKQIAGSIGVNFHFASEVKAIEADAGRISLLIEDQRFSVDAAVVAAGMESARLLKPLGIHIPMYPVQGYSATAAIKNFEEAPIGTLLDESYKVAITRMGSRVRVSGIAELGVGPDELQQRALRTLVKVGSDWFPQAANYASANFWKGVHAMLPDGAPLLGATPVRNLYINIGHGSSGWTMAAGAGKAVADIVSGRVPEIDMDGLTLARYG